MGRRSTCFSFEASGHKYRPLDGIIGVVIRLFCPRCGRVIPADQAFNTQMWESVDLSPEIRSEIAHSNGPVH